MKKALMIMHKMFPQGYTVYKFNIRARLGQEIFGNILKGNVEPMFRFKESLPNSVQVIY